MWGILYVYREIKRNWGVSKNFRIILCLIFGLRIGEKFMREMNGMFDECLEASIIGYWDVLLARYFRVRNFSKIIKNRIKIGWIG